MCIFIGIEELVANALIELLDHFGIREVSFDTLRKYGAEVVRFLNGNGEEAILVLSRDHTNGLISNYADVFELHDKADASSVISLKSDVTLEDLRSRFRVYLPLDVLLAFKCGKSLEVLGVGV